MPYMRIEDEECFLNLARSRWILALPCGVAFVGTELKYFSPVRTGDSANAKCRFPAYSL